MQHARAQQQGVSTHGAWKTWGMQTARSKLPACLAHTSYMVPDSTNTDTKGNQKHQHV
jgi:hypothetical protein